MKDRPTLKAVKDYAKKLHDESSRKVSGDVYAKPYFPPLEEAALKKMVQRCATQAALKAMDYPAASPTEVEEAKARGPELAIEFMRSKAAQADAEARRDAERSAESLNRLAGLHKREKRKESSRRELLSPGQRIDQALRELATISQVPAVALDPDPVTGRKREWTGPRWLGDQLASARAEAVALAVKLEAKVDGARVRDLSNAA